MALVTCPECRKQISDTTSLCPNCGYKTKRHIKSQLSTGCVIVILCVIILMAFAAIMDGGCQ